MKGVLDILHAWKNVLNKSFEQKREYRFIVDGWIEIRKEFGGTVFLYYTSKDGEELQTTLSPFQKGGTWGGAKIGTEAIVKWDDKVTELYVNEKKIV